VVKLDTKENLLDKKTTEGRGGEDRGKGYKLCLSSRPSPSPGSKVRWGQFREEREKKKLDGAI